VRFLFALIFFCCFQIKKMSIISDFVNWLTGNQPKSVSREAFNRHPYFKREYMTGPSGQAARGWETQWNLPAVNPVLEVMSHGMEAGAHTNVVKRTSVTYDPRGEPDAIKNMTEAEVPNFLMNDRIYAGAVERSELRPITAESFKYGI
jgi:hypothetical protein